MEPQEDYIDVKGLVRAVWSKRILILKVSAVFAILGLLYAWTTPDEYESSTTLMLESSRTQSEGGLSGLAGLAGINIPTAGTDGINPKLYPVIVQTSPFVTSILHEEFYIKRLDTSLYLMDYMHEYNSPTGVDYLKKGIKYPIVLVKTLLRGERPEAEKLVLDSSWVDLSSEERSVFSETMNRILIELDEAMGTVKVTVTMQDPLLASQVAQFTIDHIKAFITSYRISKLEENLDFVEDQLKKAKNDFLQAQYKLSEFRDRNKNLVTSSIQSQSDLLQAQYNLTFNVYNNLAQRFEQTKMSIQEQKPVFFIIEPINVPFSATRPSTFLIFMIMAIFGAFVTVGFITIWFFWKEVSKKNVL